VETCLLAEDARCSPTSSWWALVTPETRARLGFGRRLSGEHGGGCGCPNGEEIGYRNNHHMCFLDTARSDGTEFKKGLGVGCEAQKDRWPQGSTVLWGGGRRSRTLRRTVREIASATVGAAKKHRP
jgi:hypothetical protein